MGMSFNSEDMLNALDRFEDKVMRGCEMYAQTCALSLESKAKQNAPWTDRTGDARKRLRAYVEKTDTWFRIILAHGVNYGLWLELANQRKYAILMPIIRSESSKIVSGFKTLVTKIGG